jgi:hypothetical protein
MASGPKRSKTITLLSSRTLLRAQPFRPHNRRLFRRVRIGRRGDARGSHTLGTGNRARGLEAAEAAALRGRGSDAKAILEDMARDADPWRDAQTIRTLRVENERLRQRLAGMQPQKLQPGRRARFPPLMLTWDEAAEFALRRSGSWLRANIAALPDFPRPHEKFGRFSTAEIEAWVKRQFPRSAG